MLRAATLCAILPLLVASVGPARASDPGDGGSPPSAEAIVARVRDLERQIDELLAGLSPEQREEVERLLAAAAAEADGPAGAAEGPPPALTGLPAAAPSSRPGPRPVAADGCDTLGFLDTSEDGLVSAIDRYWRFLYVWIDDGDGRLERGEAERLFEAGVRSLDALLGGFTDRRGEVGDIRLGATIELGPLPAPHGGSRGVLAIDADGVARGGRLILSDAAGGSLAGLQPVTRALRVSLDGGPAFAPLCG